MIGSRQPPCRSEHSRYRMSFAEMYANSASCWGTHPPSARVLSDGDRPLSAVTGGGLADPLTETRGSPSPASDTRFSPSSSGEIIPCCAKTGGGRQGIQFRVQHFRVWY